MKYYRKLLSNPTSTIVKVGDEAAEGSIPTLSPAPVRKPSPKTPSNGSSRSALPDRNI
jgi:hypothetical protein